MVSEAKKKLVQELVHDITENPIIGVVNFENLPARQLQNMRETLLKSGVTIKMARKKLLRRALTESKQENIEQLSEKIKGMPALLFTKDNPFTLYATIQKNKSAAPAKAGQTAPKDIVVKEGATNFAPGPIISELAAVGIKTKVDGGKLAIVEDVVVAKEGDEISEALAGMLTRLDIQPMEVGLDLVSVWEKGTVFEAKQLYIDEAEYVDNFTQAAQWAFNLAMNAAYPTAETAELLVVKAFTDAKGLALEQDILTDLTAGLIVEKAQRQALSLQETAKVEVAAEETKEEPAPEQPAEEPAKEEPTPEPEAAPEPEQPAEEPAESEPEEPAPEQPEEQPAEETPSEPEPEAPAEESQSEEETSSEQEAPEEESTESQEETAEPEAEETPAEEESAPETEAAPEPEQPAEETPAEEPTPEETPSEAPEEPAETPAEPEQPAEEPAPEEPAPQPEKPTPEEKPSEPAGSPSDDSDIPSAQSLIQAMKAKFGEGEEQVEAAPEAPSAETLVEEELQKGEPVQKEDKSVEKAEDLFKELMKKGTLRKE